MSAKIGYIGLGIMGLSMTRNLLKGGFDVTVWNRTRAKVDEAVRDGAVAAESPAGVAARAEIVFMCVTDDAAVREVLFSSKDGLVSGKGRTAIVVDMSTVSPSAEIDISERLAGSGTAYMDAPVTGGDIGAREGTLTIMAGGDEDTFRKVLPALEVMGKKIAHTGPVGTGQLTKCVNQILVALNLGAMTEAFAFLQRSPLSSRKTVDLLSSGAAGSWALSNYGPRVMSGDLKPGFRAVDMLKDIKIVLSEAEKMNLQLPGIELMKDMYQSLCAIQKESLGNHALIEVYK